VVFPASGFNPPTPNSSDRPLHPAPAFVLWGSAESFWEVLGALGKS